MLVRTMAAVHGDTLAPWVLRVGTATDRRAAKRMHGRLGNRCQTSPRAQAGPGTRAPLIPMLTSSLQAIGAPPTVPSRR